MSSKPLQIRQGLDQPACIIRSRPNQLPVTRLVSIGPTSSLFGRHPLDPGIQQQTIRHIQRNAPLHPPLERLQLGDPILQYRWITQILYANRSLEQISTTRINRLQVGEFGEHLGGSRFEGADTGDLEEAVEEDDDVAVDEAVAFLVVFGDEARERMSCQQWYAHPAPHPTT